VDSDGQMLNFQFAGQLLTTRRVVDIDPLTSCQFVDLCRTLESTLQSNGVAPALKSRATLLNILTLYFEQPLDPQSQLLHRGLVRFRELLSKHACDEVSISDLADQSGIAEARVGELFRRQYGIRPVEMRTQIRLERARDMLATTALNVKQVAHQCGYPDAQYFSKVFRKQFGLSPAEIIHRYRSTDK
jgi:AraC-like DNA-binding protein